MDRHKKLLLNGARSVAIVILAIGVGTAAWLRIDPSGLRGSGLPDAFDYNLEQYQKIDPALIRYVQKMQIPVGMREVRAIAAGQQDHIFVAGDKALRTFAADGKPLGQIALDQEPYCLAVGNAGRIYVGMRDHVEVFGADGKRQTVWSRPGKRTVLTSIAAADEDVFVADAGGLVVWHYDPNGKLLGQIGKRDPSRGIPGFIVPSPYFDVAIAPDGLLRVVNPGSTRSRPSPSTDTWSFPGASGAWASKPFAAAATRRISPSWPTAGW